jgi:Icc-related predicted phosphoesterase
MRIQLLSDLHLEAHPQWMTQRAPGADVLVLAGDIGSYQAGSRLADVHRPRWALERFSPRLGHWPVPVLYVPGNHEYDALDYDATHVRLREACEALGITWLEGRALVIGGVRFVGSTLWCDFDALSRPNDSLSEQLKARAKAMRAANWYLARTGATRAGQPLLAEGVRDLGLSARAWLESTLREPFDGPTVAVTHFAPSLRSADPRFGLVPGSAGFCSAYDDLWVHARLWLHGHLHCPMDYVHHGCRVAANPLGYAEKGEQASFKPHGCWTV